MASSWLLFYFYLSHMKFLWCASYSTGHKKCSKIKLYPDIHLSLMVSNVTYYDVEHEIFQNKSLINDFFHAIEHALDYSYNKTYHYPKEISANLAHCYTKIYHKGNLSVDDIDTQLRNGFELFYDMEAYDNEYKYKMEKLMKKKYFKKALVHEFEHYFHDYHIPGYYDVYIREITVHDTSITLNERMKGFGLMIGIICGIFTLSGTVIFFYNRTDKHQKHLKQIADEFGFEDVSEVSQITHFKLF